MWYCQCANRSIGAAQKTQSLTTIHGSQHVVGPTLKLGKTPRQAAKRHRTISTIGTALLKQRRIMGESLANGGGTAETLLGVPGIFGKDAPYGIASALENF